MNKRICLILILIFFTILVWFILFFKIEYELDAFIYKDQNTIYCLSSNNLINNNIKLKINNHIYYSYINLIKSEVTLNIYFLDDLTLEIDDKKMVPIKILKTGTIIKILF